MCRTGLSRLEDIEGKTGSTLHENMVTQTTHYISEMGLGGGCAGCVLRWVEVRDSFQRNTWAGVDRKGY